MSVRAYKIIKIVQNDDPSFNLSHDEAFCNAIGFELDEQLNSDACGIVSLSVAILRDSAHLLEDGGKRLMEDLKGLSDDAYVDYSCF
jgi:hypothetical protein